MTEETRKLFDAPWKYVPEQSYLCGNGCGGIAKVLLSRHGNRFARLPELYDALMEAAGRVCFCCTEDRTCGVVQPKPEWFMDNPEFCSVKDCKYKYWWYLLRKVRDGK